MINKIYRLYSPHQIVVDFIEEDLNCDKVLVKPTKLSICHADQRYYNGIRDKKILNEKLPMALIHEAIGEIVYDATGQFKIGDKVVLIPNTPLEKSKYIKENYLETSKFRASGYDGFMQEYVFMEKDRVLKYDNINEEVASFIELISVCLNTVKNFEKKSHNNRNNLGVWGDGNLGFILSLILKEKYPESNVMVFGKNQEKLNFFSFVDEVYEINSIPKEIRLDHVFEVVGGVSSQHAIEQMINIVNPQGTISLMGVSEIPIEINTRMILEKGITLLGNSRSGREDFKDSIKLLENNEFIQNQLSKLISNVINVNSISDIQKAFEIDINSQFKTVINWNL